MDDRRRKVFRRSSIFIELGSGLELEAMPLPWQQRNDLGDLIMQNYISAMNNALSAFQAEPDAAPELSGGLADKFRNPDQVFKAAFPEFDDEATLKSLTYAEIVECIMISLEVNDLNVLKPLIDPNFKRLTPPSGTLAQATEDGPKTTSSEPSSAPVLPEPTLSN